MAKVAMVVLLMASSLRPSVAWATAPASSNALTVVNSRSCCVLGSPAAVHPVTSAVRTVRSGSLGLMAQRQDSIEAPPDLSVLNVRDMASVQGCPIKPGRLFRTACVGTATKDDTDRVASSFRTLIDLRSEKELTGKTALTYNDEVWAPYDDMIYNVTRSRTGKPKVVVPSSTGGDPPQRARHLISLIDEALYRRGVFKRLGLRKKVKAVALMPVNYEKARDVFLEHINREGLPLLNELILEYGGPSIRAVFDVLRDGSAHPVAFYCTAGKDRTGIIAMLVLSVLGVEREDILNDYVLSDNVYEEMGDKNAMVGAMQQEKLDPETFLRAPRHVMEQTMELLDERWGGPEGYLASIGVDKEQIEELRRALCE